MFRRVILMTESPSLVAQCRPDGLSREWSWHWARTGTEGLRLLEDDSAAAVLVDARLASPRAEEVLAEVRRRFPSAVRLCLFSQQDTSDLLRFASSSHRVLSLDCSAAELADVLHQARSLREFLDSPSLTAVVGRLASLPTLSTLYTRIAEELAYPDFSLATIGDLVARDAGIAVKLVQVANSALLGLRRPATSPAQAVCVLGAELTRSLVLAADLFSRYDPASLRPFSIDALWEHSRRVSDLAANVATKLRLGERLVRESALAGLFHDIGRLTIASQLAGLYREVLSSIRTNGLSVADAERTVIGATHAEVGGYLLGLWGLPDPIVEAVAWHHAPSNCPGRSVTALTAVHFAEVLCGGEERVEPDFEYLERIGLLDSLENLGIALPALTVMA